MANPHPPANTIEAALKRLEPEAVQAFMSTSESTETELIAFSQAISTKRIADALESIAGKLPHTWR
jgi:copper chaperone CopZ